MSKSKKATYCGTINPNNRKIAGKPNRAMTPEVKLAPIWIDRKNDYRRHKEKQKIRRYSDEYGITADFYHRTLAHYLFARHRINKLSLLGGKGFYAKRSWGWSGVPVSFFLQTTLKLPG